jgi:hypothetical protein
MDTETYLGDGLYASFDGWQIRLRAPRFGAEDHKVDLEPEVWERLVEYERKMKARAGALADQYDRMNNENRSR